jgi:hypothetical protein
MLKLIGLGVMVFICIIVSLIAIGATGTPWAFRETIVGTVNNVVDAANNSLQYAQNATDRINTLLVNAQGVIKTLQDSTKTISDITRDNANIQNLRQSINTSLTDIIGQLTIYANDLKGFITNADNTVNALSKTALLQESTILESANDVFDRIQTAGNNLSDYKNTIDQILSNPSSLGQRTIGEVLSEPLDAISTILASAQTAIGNAQQKISATQASLNDFSSKFGFWYNVSFGVFTALMLWVIFSQVMLILRFWPKLVGKKNTPTQPAVT